MYWMKEVGPGGHGHGHDNAAHVPSRGVFGWFGAFHRGFERRFEVFREAYRDLLSVCLRNAGKLIVLVVGFSLLSLGLFPFLGQNFFPSVDAGRFDLHVRMKTGMRIEETARNVDLIEQLIRQVIPANQLQGIIDNLGIPYSGINTSYNNTGTMSAADADILVSLDWIFRCAAAPRRDAGCNLCLYLKKSEVSKRPSVTLTVIFPLQSSRFV